MNINWMNLIDINKDIQILHNMKLDNNISINFENMILKSGKLMIKHQNLVRLSQSKVDREILC